MWRATKYTHLRGLKIDARTGPGPRLYQAGLSCGREFQISANRPRNAQVLCEQHRDVLITTITAPHCTLIVVSRSLRTSRLHPLPLSPPPPLLEAVACGFPYIHVDNTTSAALFCSLPACNWQNSNSTFARETVLKRCLRLLLHTRHIFEKRRSQDVYYVCGCIITQRTAFFLSLTT